MSNQRCLRCYRKNICHPLDKKIKNCLMFATIPPPQPKEHEQSGDIVLLDKSNESLKDEIRDLKWKNEKLYKELKCIKNLVDQIFKDLE